jgi:hypothetical protein
VSDDVVRRITLAPDPGLVKSLGTNHSLATALADLVDNSVDAKASRVLIRFLRKGPALKEVHVLDDGRGMDSDGIDRAMTLGGGRDYEDNALGHFGLGLKAAALSAGDVLTVYSQGAGSTPVGRRLVRQDMARDYSCDVLATSSCADAESGRIALVGGESGTTVRLSQLRTAHESDSQIEAATWLHLRLHETRLHLGIVFHRLLADGRIRIDLEEGLLQGAGGAPIPVKPIDPFGYHASGRPGYPRTLSADLDGRSVRLRCHVWPAKSTEDEFRLGSRFGREKQGFYVYRGDRLLSFGSWVDVTHDADDRGFGRVELEYDDIVAHVRMNPEKSSIKFDSLLGRVLRSASDDNGNFSTYLADLADSYKAARRRSRVRKPSIAPDKGFPRKLRSVIGSELEFDESYGSVSIRWKRLEAGMFLHVDLPNRTVWLNSQYRRLLVPDAAGGLNDAPLIKALVYLLTRDVFMGQYLGSKDRDNVALWQAVLGAAVDEEWSRLEKSDE